MSSSLATFAFKRARTLARPAVQQALVTHGLNTRRRGVTILAPGIHSGDPNIIIEGPTPGSRSSTIDAAGGNGSNSSQHPYASVGRNPNEAPAAGKQQQGQQQPGSPGMEGISLTSLPEPSSIPASSSGPSRPHPDHPFDTHSFVTRIEQSGFDAEASRSLMEVTKDMITARSNQARDNLLHKEDQENAAYLFKAALSELRTELSVRARNDGMTLRSTTSLIRREVDALSQKLKEDVGTLKHDIEMDMNNRKSETRSEQKGYDIAIEELNNKFTISIGDLKTEIEQAKWEATRRAITIIAVLVFTVISVVTLTSESKPAPGTNNGTATNVTGGGTMSHTTPSRDIGVGTDDEDPLAKVDLSELERVARLGGGFVPAPSSSSSSRDAGTRMVDARI